MEQHNCLGLYLSHEMAVAVLLSKHGSSRKVLGCFSICKDQIPEHEQDNPCKNMVKTLVRKLAEKKLNYNEVSVALDCSLFTQHNIHSELTDYKQIANTIRFDVEEAVAVDAMELAVAFDITGKTETGANVAVYTAKRDELSEILSNIETNGIDPTAMEPDVVCLARFMTETVPSTKTGEQLLVILGKSSCYMIVPSGTKNGPTARSFLVSSSQNIQSVLNREIALTMASHVSRDAVVSSILLAGQTHDVDCDSLTEACGLEVQTVDMLKISGVETSELTQDMTNTDLAIAYGAALEELTRSIKIDFREDFAPYAGKKRILEKGFRTVSIALTVILLALGTFFQYQVFMAKSDTNTLNQRLETDAKEILGKSEIGRQGILISLKGMYNRLTSGVGHRVGDENSVPVRLTYLLEVINSTPANINLNIAQIRVTSKNMQLRGSTSNRSGTIKLFEEINKHPKLKKGTEQITKDSFSITIESQ